MKTIAALAAACLGAAPVIAQFSTVRPPTAPLGGVDAVIGRINGAARWGSLNGTTAYSFGVTLCNLGGVELNAVANTNQHPVYGQSIYRIEDGRFEQIGMGWVFHEFGVLQSAVCSTCMGASTSAALGAGCSSDHSQSIMGLQTDLGARSEINGYTGDFVFPHATIGMNGDVLYKRLQVLDADVDSSLHPQATYLAETQCVAPDDAAAGNGFNNASWRPLIRAGGDRLVASGVTTREEPAILRWAAAEPNVQLETVDVPGEGRFIVGSHVQDLPNGMWRYSYAVYNGNSDFSGESFSVAIGSAPVGAVDMSFPLYHSGEPYTNLPWTASPSGGNLTWSTEAFAQNSNANALRWGTTYSFSFQSNLPPRHGSGSLGLFKPGNPGPQTFSVIAPEGSGAAALPFSYCQANENSTGAPTALAASGIDLAMRTMNLDATDMPAGSFGFLLTSLSRDFLPTPGGSAGNVCIGSPIGRGVGGVTFTTSPAGTASVPVSFDVIPTAFGVPVSIQPMEVRYFQAWHRDSSGGVPTSNFSNGLGISFP